MKILVYPDAALATICEDVVEFDAELTRLVEQMAEEMYAGNGIGLAAPQVGVFKNIILVDPSGGEDRDMLVCMVNPVVRLFINDLRETSEEGCLSLPGQRVLVERSIGIDVDYKTVNGNLCSRRCHGLRARIVQHECDHLVGKTILDQRVK